MGFRFQKRLSILPGVRINLSKGGVSTSLGPRGADVNIGRNGVTTNAGIPGHRPVLSLQAGRAWRQAWHPGRDCRTGLLGVPALEQDREGRRAEIRTT